MSFLSVIITHQRILRVAPYYLFVTGILVIILVVLSKRGLDFVYFNKGRNPYGVLFTVFDAPSYLKYSFHRGCFHKWDSIQILMDGLPPNQQLLFCVNPRMLGEANLSVCRAPFDDSVYEIKLRTVIKGKQKNNILSKAPRRVSVIPFYNKQ